MQSNLIIDQIKVSELDYSDELSQQEVFNRNGLGATQNQEHFSLSGVA